MLDLTVTKGAVINMFKGLKETMLFFKIKGLLCRPNRPGIHYVDRGGLNNTTVILPWPTCLEL